MASFYVEEGVWRSQDNLGKKSQYHVGRGVAGWAPAAFFKPSGVPARKPWG